MPVAPEEHHYRREAKDEKCIYQPNIGKHPRATSHQWIGKQVTVTWLPPVYTHAGWQQFPDGHSEEVHFINWVGYVHELKRQVPACDLVHIPKLNAPKGNPS